MNFNFQQMHPPLPAPEISQPTTLTIGKEVKSVPFLRSLVEMLMQNHDLISFVPGEESVGGSKMPAQIIIHDRNRVQSEVLPFYFNHASFASFRRNLSYFSFVRLGRGRHSGAVTYINDAVYELVDILHLKRRAVGCPPGGTVAVKSPTKVDAQGDQQEQAPQHNQKRSRTQLLQEPKDVASAVISGRMHACETNHDLDKKYPPTETGLLGSSKSLSAITLGTKSRRGLDCKLSTKKKRRSSKYKRSRKGGPRVHRLLYANGIVPFIHLPLRLIKARTLTDGNEKREGLSISAFAKKAGKAASSSDSDERRSKKARFDTSGSSEGGNASEASTNKNSSASVVNALLALRSRP